jgi:dimethylhistidine N-methyltransferase
MLDIAGDQDQLLAEVLDGLTRTPKTLPCKLFYDQRGSQLFDEICELPEYYLTRTEIEIMSRHAPEMARCVGPNACIVEPGAGSSVKIRYLLDALSEPACFVPIDISAEHLRQAAAEIERDYPELLVHPVEADYTRDLVLPSTLPAADRTIAFFPGSTIGNFLPDDAARFLRRMARLVEAGGGLLIGVDLHKSAAIVEPAYNDARGVTAEFNRNILNVINNTFGGDFDPDLFEHRAFFDARQSRVDIRLVSTVWQTVSLARRRIHFDRGEPIITEYSYKHRQEDFQALARRAGMEVDHVWQDARGWFSVQYLTVRT